MAVLNTALMVRARQLLDNWGADLSTNKNLKIWEEENGPVAEELKTYKSLRLPHLLKGTEVNLLCPIHLLLWNHWQAESKNKN